MSKIIIVMGGSRSGTTITTAILKSIGVNMVHDKINFNFDKTSLDPCGALEDKIFSTIITEKKERGENISSDIKEFIKSNSKLYNVWGIKSAKMHILFEELYNEIISLGHEPYIIVTFRDILQQSKSEYIRQSTKNSSDNIVNMSLQMLFNFCENYVNVYREIFKKIRKCKIELSAEKLFFISKNELTNNNYDKIAKNLINFIKIPICSINESKIIYNSLIVDGFKTFDDNKITIE